MVFLYFAKKTPGYTGKDRKFRPCEKIFSCYTKTMMYKTVMKKIESYLKGDISAEDFSYDFPVTYSLYCAMLDRENPALSRLLEKEVKAVCNAYDPFDFYNMDCEKILSEEDFRRQIEALYEKARSLLETT